MVKSKYSKERQTEICSYIEKGLHNKDAARLAGISESSFYHWQEKHPEFLESIKKATLKRKLFLLRKILKASNRTWQAAAWYLERVYPKEFSRQRTKSVEHSGKVRTMAKILRVIQEEKNKGKLS